MKPSSLGAVPAFQRFLRRNGLVFACAESCTGGLLARQMTAPAGASQVFWGGAVTYSNEAKTALLGVEPGLFAAHGAVSGPVASAMVRGIGQHSGASVAVSLTGVAGPSGGSAEKPVGTVWFGVMARREGVASVVAVRHRFDGPRDLVQAQAARWARIVTALWWESGMDLDSLRSLTDNEGKLFVEAFQPPSSFPSNPL